MNIRHRNFTAKEWLNPAASLQLIENIESEISSGVRERLLKNTGSTKEYGYNFPELNAIRQDCLKEIRQFYTTNGKRPRVADIGAGFGSMTWKILAAGGQVDAFEIQIPTAAELKRRISSMNPQFWENANLDTILAVFPGDMLSILDDSTFFEKYDFIWLGQVVHLLTPRDLKHLNFLLQKVLKPEGKVFIETNSIHSLQQTANYSVVNATYQNAKVKQLEFPCFIGINQIIFTNKARSQIMTTFVSALDSEEMKLNSIPYETMLYGADYLAPSDLMQENEKKCHVPIDKDVKSRFHLVMMLLDAPEAVKTFTNAGFYNVETFYYDVSKLGGQRLPDPFDSQDTPGLAVTFKKPKTPLANLTFLNFTHNHDLLLRAEALCKNKKEYQGYLLAIKYEDYSLALRRAHDLEDLQLISLLLDRKDILKLDINAISNSRTLKSSLA